jgi:hypothetical protein
MTGAATAIESWLRRCILSDTVLTDLFGRLPILGEGFALRANTLSRGVFGYRSAEQF